MDHRTMSLRQYGRRANLAAREAIFGWQENRVDLPAVAIAELRRVIVVDGVLLQAQFAKSR